MNPEAILALISDLTAQVHGQAARIQELEKALEQAQAVPASDTK